MVNGRERRGLQAPEFDSGDSPLGTGNGEQWRKPTSYSRLFTTLHG
jgi:hypothetical protein